MLHEKTKKFAYFYVIKYKRYRQNLTNKCSG